MATWADVSPGILTVPRHEEGVSRSKECDRQHAGQQSASAWALGAVHRQQILACELAAAPAAAQRAREELLVPRAGRLEAGVAPLLDEFERGVPYEDVADVEVRPEALPVLETRVVVAERGVPVRCLQWSARACKGSSGL